MAKKMSADSGHQSDVSFSLEDNYAADYYDSDEESEGPPEMSDYRSDAESSDDESDDESSDDQSYSADVDDESSLSSDDTSVDDDTDFFKLPEKFQNASTLYAAMKHKRPSKKSYTEHLKNSSTRGPLLLLKLHLLIWLTYCQPGTK